MKLRIGGFFIGYVRAQVTGGRWLKIFAPFPWVYFSWESDA